jgi:hypothetical protein
VGRGQNQEVRGGGVKATGVRGGGVKATGVRGGGVKAGACGRAGSS